MSEEDKRRALEEVSTSILRAVATRFVIVTDKKTLCEWCARYPEVDVFLDQVKETRNLAVQLAGGEAKQAKGGLLILDGGKSE